MASVHVSNSPAGDTAKAISTQAVRNLKTFDAIDNVPNIDNEPVSVSYLIAGDFNTTSNANVVESNLNLSPSMTDEFNDSYEQRAFNLSAANLAENDITVQMSQLLSEAESFINLLYTCRSCSRTLLSISGKEEEETKKKIHMRSFEILQPEMDKLSALNSFQQRLIEFIVNKVVDTWIVDGQIKAKTQFIGIDIYKGLANLIDALVRLDSLKDMKSSLLNDFAAYKRAFHNCKHLMENDDEVDSKIKNLQMFLADPGCPKLKIMTNLKYALYKNDKARKTPVVEFMSGTFAWIIEQLVNGYFTFPEEKWRLIRTLPYIFWLVDSKEEMYGSENAFKSKKVNCSAFLKIFNAYPIIPLHCDMHVSLTHVIQSCPNFDRNSSLCSQFVSDITSQQKQKHYSLTAYWETIRTQYEDFVPRFMNIVNRIKTVKANMNENADDIEISLAHAARKACEEGIGLLSAWKEKILAQAAYKYATPVEMSKVRSMIGSDNIDQRSELPYERVVSFNYSSQDLWVLLKSISLLKSLSSLILKNESILSPAIRLSVYNTVQNFVQLELLDLMHNLDCKAIAASPRKMMKKKITGLVSSRTGLNDLLESVLLLRDIAADWADREKPSYSQDYKMKPNDRQQKPLCKNRCVAPSPTQLKLLVNLIGHIESCLVSQKKRGGLFSFASSSISSQKNKSIADKSMIEALSNFQHQAEVFPYVLSLSSSLQKLSNVGELYFREFYLEMTKCIQFPISTSLPWIMTRELIEAPNGSNILCLLNALDVYNDAANFALNQMKSRYMFDEIEAEVNLVFDQLTFLVSEHIYAYHKKIAANCIAKSHQHILKEIRKSQKRVNSFYYRDIKYSENNESEAADPNTDQVNAKTDEEEKNSLGSDKRNACRPEKSVKSKQHSTMEESSNYSQLLKLVLQQRHINLLGRTVNLNELVTRVLRSKLVTDIEFLLHKFECGTLMSIREFNAQLELIHRARDSLAEVVQVDEFSVLLSFCNNSVASPTGRIYRHVMQELVNDFFPNMFYNQFTESFTSDVSNVAKGIQLSNKGPFSKLLPGAQHLSKQLERIYNLERNSFGKEHITDLISSRNFSISDSVLLESVSKNVNQMITSKLIPYVNAIYGSLSDIRLTKYETGTEFSLLSFQSQLNKLLLFEDLRNAFDAFKHVGNAFAFCHLIQNDLDKNEIYSYIQAIPFIGNLDDKNSGDGNTPMLQAMLAAKKKNSDMVGTSEYEDTRRVDQIYCEMIRKAGNEETKRIKGHGFLFKRLLGMVEANFEKTQPENMKEKIFKTFSALQFIYCNNWNDGDGFLWGGVVLLFLTGRMHKLDLDLVAHILRVEEMEQIQEKNHLNPDIAAAVPTANSTKFLEKANCISQKRTQIMSLFQATMEPQLNSLVQFHPPQWTSVNAYVDNEQEKSDAKHLTLVSF